MKPLSLLILPILLLLMANANAQDVNHIIAKGNEAYQQQQYDKAIEKYQEALKISPGNEIAYFNLGNALFRSKKYEEAAAIFEAATQHAEERTFQSKLNYNRGVSFTMQKKLQESIDAYKQSLRLNSADTLARENLQRALNELKRQQQQNDQQKKQQSQKKESEPKPRQSKLNKQQVQQLLKALEEQEKRLQDKMMHKTPSPGQPDKDW